MRVHRKCCGMDVHKKMIAACLLTEDAEGNSVAQKRLWPVKCRTVVQCDDFRMARHPSKKA